MIFKCGTDHLCIKIWFVIAIMVWDGIELEKADHLYDKLKFILEESGIATKHQCEMNKTKTCTCQGHKAKKEGASYSFGCSWSVYHDSCKYAKSSTRIIRKYSLANESQEG
jgi:methylcytosine dioxygenase